MAEQVGFEIAVHALQHGGDALQPHAGIDRGLGQVEPLAAGQLLILHEDQIPDFDKAVAVLVGRTRRAAGNLRTMVVEDFGTGAAGPGVAHRPEIGVGGDADDLPVRQAGDLAPQPEGLVVIGIDGDHQPVLGQPQIAGEQFPGKTDRVFLEIIAEGEIPQHLEESEMAGGIADIVEVVMLAPGAHAFLGGGGADIGPLLAAGEDVLELDHAGIGEQQGGIVARHQGRGGHHGVAVAGEIIQETRADVGKAFHGFSL